jgi:hypothetical protein
VWSGPSRVCSYAGGAHRRRWHSSCSRDLNICAQSAPGLCSDQGVFLTAVENCSPARFDWTREVTSVGCLSPLSSPLLSSALWGSRLLPSRLLPFRSTEIPPVGGVLRGLIDISRTITRTAKSFYRSICNERPCEVASCLSIFY